MTPYIDYSQYYSYQTCPWLWYEKYITGARRKRVRQERSKSARTIGTLVHTALENLHKTGDPALSQELIDELYADPEAVLIARDLIHLYLKTYTGEQLFKECVVEAPIQATINGVPILAKIDTYTTIENFMEILCGVSPAVHQTLEPGLWIIEDKTKAASIPLASYMQGWEADKQIDFQMLALQSHMQTEVKGAIINVLEKPRNSPPRRKCKGCGQYFEYAAYINVPGQVDKHSCIMCGHVQKLSPLGDPKGYQGLCYRVLITRTPQQLEVAAANIAEVWRNMNLLCDWARASGDALTENQKRMTTKSCVHPIYGACEFFEPHVFGMREAEEGPDFEILDNPLRYTGVQDVQEED